ncbi:MAG: hypothetical protein ABL912_01710 [Novosphingobium sp.]
MSESKAHQKAVAGLEWLYRPERDFWVLHHKFGLNVIVSSYDAARLTEEIGTELNRIIHYDAVESGRVGWAKWDGTARDLVAMGDPELYGLPWNSTGADSATR